MNLINIFYNRLNKQNKNLIAIAVGGTGSGKSWGMISLCKTLDKDFNLSRIIFTYDEFIQLINEPEKNNMKKGSCMLWDEAGVGMASRDALTKNNKQTGKVVQTFRNLNYGLFFTVPSMGMVDKQIRDLSHYIFKPMSKPNKKMMTNEFTVKEIQHNEEWGKTYIKRPRVPDEKGVMRTVNAMVIAAPPKKLREEYEIKKFAFQDRFYNKEKYTKKTIPDKEKYNNTITKLRKKHDGYSKKWANKIIFDYNKIKIDFDIPYRMARSIKYELESELNGQG